MTFKWPFICQDSKYHLTGWNDFKMSVILRGVLSTMVPVFDNLGVMDKKTAGNIVWDATALEYLCSSVLSSTLLSGTPESMILILFVLLLK